MLRFAVSEEKNIWLRKRMEMLGISEDDIQEKFVRSSGKGGQKLNKAATCVYLKHIPTGIEIKCMKDRSQSINRFLARRELVLKIEELLGRSSKEFKRGKIRKQKSKRRKRAVLKYG